MFPSYLSLEARVSVDTHLHQPHSELCSLFSLLFVVLLPDCLLVGAGAAEAAGAADALLELGDLDHVGGVDALDDELGDAVALADRKVGVAVVEQQHFHLAPVVGVDDARARVDEVLGGQAGAGGDAAVFFWVNVLVESFSFHVRMFLCFLGPGPLGPKTRE